jgi:hypothetical protein
MSQRRARHGGRRAPDPTPGAEPTALPSRALRERQRAHHEAQQDSEGTATLPILDPDGTAAFPVIRPQRNARLDHLVAALVAAAATALLVLGGTAGLNPLVGVIAALQALLVAGWALQQPELIGTAVIAGAASIASDIVLTVRDRATLASVLGVFGLSVLALILHQLIRRPIRTRVAESMAGLAALVVITGALGALIVVRRGTSGEDLLAATVLATGIALVVGHLVDAVVPAPRFADDIPRGLPALLLGAVAGAATAIWRLRDVSSVGTVAAGFLGAALGLVAGLVAVGAAFVDPDIRVRWAAPYLRVVLPVALAAPVAYVLSRAVMG